MSLAEQFPGNGRSNMAAHAAVAKALRTGRLVKPDCCSRCGENPVGCRGQSLVHAHHDDYDKPLEVMWLCTMCHAERHRELGWGIGGQTTALIRKGRTREEYQAIHRARFRAQYSHILSA